MPRSTAGRCAASEVGCAGLLAVGLLAVGLLGLCGVGCSSDDDDAGDDASGGSGGGSHADGGHGGGAGAHAGSGAGGRSGAGGALASAGTGSAVAGAGTGAGAGAQSGAGGEGAGSGGRSGTGGAGGKSSAGAGGQPAGDECILARRLDRCCPEYEAVLRSALADDECLHEETGPAPEPMHAQHCFEQSPISCAAVLCGPQLPPSRVVTSNGAGGCQYVDECTAPDDCVIALRSSACCECARSMPASLLEVDRCLVPEGTAAPQDCPACELPVLCGQCEPPPDAVTCVIGDALNRCQ